jgi:hypothetical protein
MATSTGTAEKINVRSPFYITVDSTGAPTSPTDPTPVEPIPDEYNPPATVTQVLDCDANTSTSTGVAHDVGTRIFRINTAGRTGSMSLSFTLEQPVKISHQFSTDTSPTVVGYRGSSEYEQELIALGIPQSELTGLGTTNFGFSVTIPASHTTSGHFDLTIDAPLRTDSYQVTFGCPDAIEVSQTLPDPPVTVPTGTYDFVSGTECVMMKMYPSSGNYSLRYAPDPPNLTMKMYVNGTLTKTFTHADLNFGSSNPIYIAMTNQQFTDLGGTSITALNVSPNTIDEYQTNTIGFQFNQRVSMPKFEFISTQLFENSDTTSNEWADPYKMFTFDYYSYADKAAVDNALSTYPFLVPRVNGSYTGSVQSFDANVIYGFEYRPNSVFFGLGAAGPIDYLTAKNYIERKAESTVVLIRDGITYRKKYITLSGVSGATDYYQLG